MKKIYYLNKEYVVNKDVDYYIRPIQSEFHIVSESWQSDNAIKPYAVEVEFDNNNIVFKEKEIL